VPDTNKGFEIMNEKIVQKFKKCKITIVYLLSFLALWLLGCFIWLDNISWFKAFLTIYTPFFVVMAINSWILHVEMNKGKYTVGLLSFCIYTVFAIVIMVDKDIAGVFLSIVTCILAIIIFVAGYSMPFLIAYIYTKKAWDGDAQRQYDLGIFLMKKHKYHSAIGWFEKSAVQERYKDAESKLNLCRKRIEECDSELLD